MRQCYLNECAYANATHRAHQRVTEEACERIAQVETAADLTHVDRITEMEASANERHANALNSSEAASREKLRNVEANLMKRLNDEEMAIAFAQQRKRNKFQSEIAAMKSPARNQPIPDDPAVIQVIHLKHELREQEEMTER